MKLFFSSFQTCSAAKRNKRFGTQLSRRHVTNQSGVPCRAGATLRLARNDGVFWC